MRTFAGLCVLGLAALLGACGSTVVPSSSPPAAPGSPTATLAATAPPSTTPTPTDESVATDEPVGEVGPGIWAQNPPSPLLTGAAVRVLVAELNVRERPSTAARKVGTVTPKNILTVSSAPVESDGYIWYAGIVRSATGKLPPLPSELGGAGEPTAGWFAATKGSTAYVELLDPRCPDVVDLVYVEAMLAAERLACFGDRSIELEGTFGCMGCGIELAGRYEPAWLAYPGVDLLWENWMADTSALRIRFPPSGVGAPEQGSIIRLRGHFRDDAADTCAIATTYPWDRLAEDPPVHQVAAVVARELCRQELVVESYEVRGSIDLSG